jgi:hypothetical protein
VERREACPSTPRRLRPRRSRAISGTPRRCQGSPVKRTRTIQLRSRRRSLHHLSIHCTSYSRFCFVRVLYSILEVLASRESWSRSTESRACRPRSNPAAWTLVQPDAATSSVTAAILWTLGNECDVWHEPVLAHPDGTPVCDNLLGYTVDVDLAEAFHIW